KLALDVARIGVWELDPQRGLTKVDRRVAEQFGLENEGRYPAGTFFARMTETDALRVRDAIETTFAEGGRFDEEYRITPPDGTDRVVRAVARKRLSSMPGRGASLLGVNLDVTAEAEVAQMRELMLREMNHRVKNLFTVIAGLMRLAARDAQTPKELVADMSRRITALARSHELTQTIGQSSRLGEAIAVAIDPYSEGREISLSGPPVPISQDQLTSLALIFHEWATNSAKYGVLGDVGGKLDITWGFDAAPEGDTAGDTPARMIRVSWAEHFDRPLPTPATPEGRGFGTTLLGLSAAQLGGRIEVEQTETARRNILVYTEE
ncbi:sensor histidine kinase, partial [Acidimangrovimonas sediminis]|uniref:sensor histidine kinase n=1 Tax=Acidimangrovimonas sediminis TaxID=2056283 RepID=UPI002FCDFC74